MNMLKAKKEELQERGYKGFTLMEMLIVVAIIAILVAIAIPTFTNQLNQAKMRTDEANARSIYASLTANHMLGLVTNNDLASCTASGANAKVTYDGNVYEFSDVFGSITSTLQGTGANARIQVEVTTNGKTYTFPGGTQSTS